MLKHWSKLLTGDCTVIEVGEYTVYPIHRVGHTSLMLTADTTYTNEEISKLKHIDVLIRDPNERFISGVNEYCKHNKIEVLEAYKKILEDNLVDSHFVPQYVWLMRLYRFFKGEITIRPFQYIANITNVHERNDTPIKVQVIPPESFTRVDSEIIKNTTAQRRYWLEDIIKDYKNVLS
jgi:hypothetical protein